MNNETASRFRFQNWLHTIFLLSGMLLLLGLIGWLVAGFIGVVWALSMGVVFIATTAKLSSRLILFLTGASPVANNQLAQLRLIIEWLANRSQLAHLPKLYYIPGSAMLALSVGMHRDTVIAISDGLLRGLNTRELAAVLAHEVSHIQSKDLWMKVVADVTTRITSLMALTGYIMMIIYLPLYILQDEDIPWVLLLLLIVSPNLSALMQLALSRTREFSADLQAVKLTGDPEGLISALGKIERYQINWIEKLLLPGVSVPYPSLLRTHPLTEERIKRLQTLVQHDELHPFINDQKIYPVRHEILRSTPWWRSGNLWH